MKWSYFNTVLVFFLFICGLIIGGELRKRDSNAITTKTVTIVDTVYRQSYITNPVPYEVKSILIDTIYKIDTIKVIEQFYEEKKYKLPFEDSLIFGEVNLSIAKNELKYFDIKYNTLHITKEIIQEKIHEEKFSIEIGGLIGVGKNRATGELLIMTSINKHGLIVGYDLVNKTTKLGYSHKIISKKK